MESARILSETSFQVVFSEAVNADTGDFLNFFYYADGNTGVGGVSVAIISVSGSGSNTIVVTTAALPGWGGPGFGSGIGTGSVDIGPGVEDLSGNPFVPDTQNIATNIT
ncbi:MAG: hypothetical protein CVU99_07370 [Firmicutes bacterium HGW-Firmicutes-4]|nr:MAG: hypothetical protein CVU99_07370 [Firmicutes bacterium HGW-Firmicutes-4]